MTAGKYSKSNYIRTAIEELNKSVAELSEHDLGVLFRGIREFYTEDLNYPLWERIKGSISVKDEKGWISMGSLIAGKESILFLDPAHERFAIKVSDGRDLVEILDVCGYMTFYVTNPDLDFLLAYNDHDSLIVKGETAENWMNRNFNGPYPS